MGDSQTITVVVNYPVVQAYIIEFDITPTSGIAPLTVHCSGWLSRSASSREGQGGFAIVNNETIKIQMLSGGNWVDTGANAQTMPLGTQSGWFGVDVAITDVGTYQLRAHYDGNSSKGLLGC